MMVKIQNITPAPKEILVVGTITTLQAGEVIEVEQVDADANLSSDIVLFTEKAIKRAKKQEVEELKTKGTSTKRKK